MCLKMPPPPYFLNNSMKYQPMLLVYDKQHLEETGHWKVKNFRTTPINCCRTTLGSLKSEFSALVNSNFN